MFQPKVSIVIPVYNGSDFVAEAIDSALEQSYPFLEVIVINDGSNDAGATEAALLPYLPKIRYFTKPNGGVASALNLAIEKMEGEYFSWLSHDDLYTPDKIEKQIAALNRLNQKNIILYSDYAVFQEQASSATPVRLKGVAPAHFRYWLTVENSLHGCTLLIPKQAFLDQGRFREDLKTTQDYDLWFQLAEKFSMVHLPEILVKARSHPNQNSHKLSALVLDECNALLSGFIRSLSLQEIQAVTGKSLQAAYEEIAFSMAYRGFREAEKLAQDYALQYTVAGSAHRSLQPLRKAHYFIQRLIKARKYLFMKKQLKKLLGWGIKKQEVLPPLPLNTGLKEKFAEVYEKNLFCGRESRSGEGSNLIQTQKIRDALPQLFKEFKIQSMLDAPCGDWYWMKETELPLQRYIGVDIVGALIKKNQETYGSSTVQFLCQDLTLGPLPKVDLIFSRDCLVHLSFPHALKILDNFKRSGATYLLTTTFTDRQYNEDLGQGFWRPLNKQLAPFNFPPPLRLINEGCTEGNQEYGDKSLGLWLLKDLSFNQKEAYAG